LGIFAIEFATLTKLFF